MARLPCEGVVWLIECHNASGAQKGLVVFLAFHPKGCCFPLANRRLFDFRLDWFGLLAAYVTYKDNHALALK